MGSKIKGVVLIRALFSNISSRGFRGSSDFLDIQEVEVFL